MKSKVLWGVALIVFVGIGAFIAKQTLVGSFHSELRPNYDYISKLPLGTDRQVVLTQLGNPESTKDRTSVECWYYPFPSLNATNGTVCVSKSTGKVVFTRYSEGDAYHAAPGYEYLADPRVR